MVAQLVAQFDQSWTPSRANTAVGGLSEQNFSTGAGPKFAFIEQWRQCGSGPALVEITVEHYNSSSSDSSTPPAAVSAPLPEDTPDRFLIYAGVGPATSELADKLGEIVASRRRAEELDPTYPAATGADMAERSGLAACGMEWRL
ncbi:hypothetical protein [Paracoccus aminophilus]|uniref:hypothetical protein n=1 Tax=Paracoccus aminophilus TaxID=34003 RepID=UPI0005A2D7DD|nr:hypothetical protein [Paracoccus aminophilus]